MTNLEVIRIGTPIPGFTMQTNQQGHLVLEYMRLCNVDHAESVPVEAVVDYGIDKGYGLEDVETALIQASMNGWVVAIDDQIHLTKSGYAVMNPANDNSAPDTTV
jgi:hypothetical protein